LLGFGDARSLIERRRLRFHDAGEERPFRTSLLRFVAQLGLATLLPAAWLGLTGRSVGDAGLALLTALGYWATGGCVSVLVSFGERLIRDLRPQRGETAAAFDLVAPGKAVTGHASSFWDSDEESSPEHG
jgi:hypothetical protein